MSRQIPKQERERSQEREQLLKQLKTNSLTPQVLNVNLLEIRAIIFIFIGDCLN